MIKISFRNEAGELDHRFVDDEEKAAEMACAMIRAAGSLQHGDRIVITETSEAR